MVRKLGVAALAALVFTAACGRKAPGGEAADAAHALLAAAWAGDAQGFEAHLDRASVRADLRRQLLLVAQANMLAVEGGASDRALDRMITPDAFRLTDAATGQPLAAAPSKDQTAALIAPLGKNRACLHARSDPNACLLTFAREASGWRLVGMAPAGFTIAVPPEPPKQDS